MRGKWMAGVGHNGREYTVGVISGADGPTAVVLSDDARRLTRAGALLGLLLAVLAAAGALLHSAAKWRRGRG